MEIALAFLGVLGGLITFSVGLWQYHKAQRWKVLEFVASEIKDFSQKPGVSNAMLMLDYENLEIDLFPDEKQSASRFVRVNEGLIVKALAAHPDQGFDDTEVAIRNTFDHFFGCLERFDQYIETGLVKYKDFHPYLRYWLAILVEADSGLKTQALVSAVHAFLVAFKYEGVLRLLGRYREHASIV